ncbi:HPr family phosphocarrier protein [Angustibacter peucedani]
MPERRVTIGSSVGLHARPAATFARAAAETGVAVTIATADKGPLPAGSLLSVMTLGAEHGTEVVLAAEGDGADAALDQLATLLESDLDAG